MAPEVQALLNAMRELESLLERNGEDIWSISVKRAADTVARTDAHGLTQLLGLFGGMGSLDDLVLHKDGLPLVSENERLNTLRSNAWGLATRLKREID
ncbi:DUF6966 domain-containing protein [Mesorhizobium sp. ANAO-SY3R2]|uniref:DUF6966 domain-containing protein n=1 Tax=Mesorhizobium sp. ANAO-SY3R2 TaxID=3166644 RepID=UPI00367287CA